MTTALEGSERSALRPCRFYLRERPATHCTEGCVGPRAGGQVRKISPPPGFDPRTPQPVDSRYTDCATRPTLMWLNVRKRRVQNWGLQNAFNSRYMWVEIGLNVHSFMQVSGKCELINWNLDGCRREWDTPKTRVYNILVRVTSRCVCYTNKQDVISLNTTIFIKQESLYG